jgi:hypothetical protein
MAQFSGTTYDLYQTYGSGWFPDQLQSVVRRILTTSVDDGQSLPSTLIESLITALDEQSRSLQTAAQQLDAALGHVEADAAALLLGKRRALHEEVARATAAASCVVDTAVQSREVSESDSIALLQLEARCVRDVAAVCALLNAVLCARRLHRNRASCHSGSSIERDALAHAERCDVAALRRQRQLVARPLSTTTTTTTTTATSSDGAARFDVELAGRAAVLTIDDTGVRLVDVADGKVLRQQPMSHVRRWSAANQSLTLDFGDYESDYTVMRSDQSEAISSAIAGRIDLLLKRRKDESSASLDDAGGTRMATIHPTPTLRLFGKASSRPSSTDALKKLRETERMLERREVCSRKARNRSLMVLIHRCTEILGAKSRDCFKHRQRKHEVEQSRSCRSSVASQARNRSSGQSIDERSHVDRNAKNGARIGVEQHRNAVGNESRRKINVAIDDRRRYDG